MNKEISKALVGVASAATLLAFKPELSSMLDASSSLLSVGLELRQLLVTTSPESKRALARLRKKVRHDFSAWSKSEGIQAAAEISIADASLASALPQIFLGRDSLASAAFEPDGFLRAGTSMIISDLARIDPLFQERPNNLARQYATVVITSALRAVLSEREYFEVLQPHLDLKLAQIIGEIDRKVTRVLASAESAGAMGGLSRDEVRSLLRAFFEERVPEDAARSLLLEKAKELRALRTELTKIESADTNLTKGLAQVTSAIGAGQYVEADAILSRITKESESSAFKALCTTISLLHRHADLAHAQAKYSRAADTYGRAAAVATALDTRAAWLLLGAQADSLMEHALKTPGTAYFERAMAVAFKRIDMAGPNDADRAESIGRFTMMVGLYAQRATDSRARETISIAIELVRDVLNKLNPLSEGRLTAQVANSFGALLNNALSIGVVEGRQDMQNQAVERLTQAWELATKHAPTELPAIRQNLATALRRQAEDSTEPGPILRRAIENRLAAIDETQSEDVRDLSNCYESLANDYQALMRTEGKPDRQTFLHALAAHRRALQLRRKGSYAVDAAQSRLNIGLLYLEIAFQLPDTTKGRFLRLSKRHLEFGLNRSSQEGAPKQWSRLCYQWCLASIFLLFTPEECANDSALRVLGERIVSLIRFAHTTGAIPLLMDCAQLSHQLNTYLLELRRCSLVDIPRAHLAALDELLRIYRWVPEIGNDLELWAATVQFIAGYLSDDLQTATDARRRASRVANSINNDDSDHFSAVVKEVLEHMDGNLIALQQRLPK